MYLGRIVAIGLTKEFREKYNISQRELTAILGWGKMTINRYERGGVPTKSQSDYIRLLIENESKFIEKVKEAYNQSNNLHLLALQ